MLESLPNRFTLEHVHHVQSQIARQKGFQRRPVHNRLPVIIGLLRVQPLLGRRRMETPQRCANV